MKSKNETFIYQDVVDALVNKLKELPDGTEVCTSLIVEMIYGTCHYRPNTKCEYDYGSFAIGTSDYFELDRLVRKRARGMGIRLED